MDVFLKDIVVDDDDDHGNKKSESFSSCYFFPKQSMTGWGGKIRSGKAIKKVIKSGGTSLKMEFFAFIFNQSEAKVKKNLLSQRVIS